MIQEEEESNKNLLQVNQDDINSRRKQSLFVRRRSKKRKTSKIQVLNNNAFFQNLQNIMAQRQTYNEESNDKQDQDIPIKFGDIIQIKYQQNIDNNKKNYGLIFGGFLPNQKLYGKVINQNEENNEWCQQQLFQIVPKTIYGSTKDNKNIKLNLLIEKDMEQLNEIIDRDDSNKNQIYENENQHMNQQVVYGEVIILRHVLTGYYLTLDDWNDSQSNHGLKIYLKNYIEKNNCFKIIPLSKMNQQGQIIQYKNSFLLARYREENLFLGLKECNKIKRSLQLSTKRFQWQFKFFGLQKDLQKNDLNLKFGDTIKIVHQSTQTNLIAIPNSQTINKIKHKFIFMSIHNTDNTKKSVYQNYVDMNKERSFDIKFVSQNQNEFYNLWEIKGLSCQDFKYLKEDDEFYIRNVGTGLYLILNYKDEFELVSKKNLVNFKPFKCSKNFDLDNQNNVNRKEKYFIKTNEKLLSIQMIEDVQKQINRNKNQGNFLNTNMDYKLNIEDNRVQNQMFRLKKQQKVNSINLQVTTLRNYFVEFYDFIYYWGITDKDINQKEFEIQYYDVLNEIGLLQRKEQQFQIQMDIMESIFLNQTNDFNKDIFVQDKLYQILHEIINNIIIRLYVSFQDIDNLSRPIQNQNYNLEDIKYKFQKKKNNFNLEEYSQSIGMRQLENIINRILQFLSKFSKYNKQVIQELQKDYYLIINLSHFYFKPCQKILLNICKYNLELPKQTETNLKFIRGILELYLKRYNQKQLINSQFSIYNNLKIFQNLIKIFIKFQDDNYFKRLINYVLPIENLEGSQLQLSQDNFIMIVCDSDQKYNFFKSILEDNQKNQTDNEDNIATQTIKISLENLNINQRNFFEVLLSLYTQIKIYEYQQIDIYNIKDQNEFSKIGQFITLEFVQQLLQQNISINLKKSALQYILCVEENIIDIDVTDIINNKVLCLNIDQFKEDYQNLYQYFQIKKIDKKGIKIKERVQQMEDLFQYLKNNLNDLSNYQLSLKLIKKIFQYVIILLRKGLLQLQDIYKLNRELYCILNMYVQQYNNEFSNEQFNVKDVKKIFELQLLCYVYKELAQQNNILWKYIQYVKKQTNDVQNDIEIIQDFEIKEKEEQFDYEEDENYGEIWQEELLLQHQSINKKLKFIQLIKDNENEKDQFDDINTLCILVKETKYKIQKMINYNVQNLKHFKELNEFFFVYDKNCFKLIQKDRLNMTQSIYYQIQDFQKLCFDFLKLNILFKRNQYTYNNFITNIKFYRDQIRSFIILLNQLKKEKIFFNRIQLFLYHSQVFQFILNILFFSYELKDQEFSLQERLRNLRVLIIDFISLVIFQNDFIKKQILQYKQIFYDLLSEDIDCYDIITDILLYEYKQDNKKFLQSIQNFIQNLDQHQDQIDLINEMLQGKQLRNKDKFQYSRLRQFNMKIKLLVRIQSKLQNDNNLKQILFFDMLQRNIIQKLVQRIPQNLTQILEKFFEQKSQSHIFTEIINNVFNLSIELLKDYDNGIKCFQNILSIDQYVYLMFNNDTKYFFKGKLLEIFSILFMKQMYKKKNEGYVIMILEQIKNDINSHPYFINEFLPQSQLDRNKKFDKIKYQQFENLQINSFDYWNYLFQKVQNKNYGLVSVINSLFKFLELENCSQKIQDQLQDIVNGLINLKKKIQQIQKDNSRQNLMKWIFMLNQVIYFYNNLTNNNTIQQKNQLREQVMEQQKQNLLIKKFQKKFREYLFVNKLDFHYNANELLLDPKLPPKLKLQNLLKKIDLIEIYSDLKKEIMNINKNSNSIKLNNGDKKKLRNIDLFKFFQYLEVQMFSIENYQDKFIEKNEFEFTEGLKKYYERLVMLNIDSDSNLQKIEFMVQKNQDQLEQKFIQDNHDEQINQSIEIVKQCILKQQSNLNLENLFDIKAYTLNNKECYFIFYTLNKIIQNYQDEENDDQEIDSDQSYNQFLQNIYDYGIVEFCIYTFVIQDNLVIKNNILNILIQILDIIEKDCQDKLFNIFKYTKRGTNFLQSLLMLYNKLKLILLEKNSDKKYEINNELKLYQIDCSDIFCTILNFMQKLSDNCYKDLQLILSAQVNTKRPINYLKKIINFFISFSEQIINEYNNQASYSSNVKVVMKQKKKQQKKFNLLNQLYKTIEELTMGPCEQNMLLVVNNQRLMSFIQRMINYDINIIKQDQLLSEIFSISIKFLFLLFMTNGTIADQICQIQFDFQYLTEKMVTIYEEYIKNNIVSLEFELYCDYSDNQKKQQDDYVQKFLKKYAKIVTCKDCTFQNCNQGKVSEQQKKYVKLCQKIYQILKVKNHIDFQLDEEIQKKLKKSQIQSTQEIKQRIKKEAIKYFSKYEEQTELYYNDKIIQYRFVVPYICFFIGDDLVKEILDQTTRSSHDEKLKQFINDLPRYIERMKQQQQLSQIKKIKMVIDNEKRVYNFRFLMTIFLNFFIMYTLKYESENDLIIKDDFDDNNLISLLKKKGWVFFIYLFFCSFVLFIIIIEVIINIINNLPNTRCKYRNKKIFQINVLNKNKNLQKKLKKLKKFWQNSKMIFLSFSFSNFLLITASCLAFIIPWFWGVILLDVVSKNKEMHDIIRSVTKNKTQLLKTIFLALIVMYIYSFIAFSYFPNDFGHEEDQDFKNYCNSLWNCFVSTVYNGIRAGGGIGEALGHLSRESDHYWLRVFFDLSFFLIVIICLLNIVFGIIIDTFADLRDKRNELRKVIQTRCFICEQEKYKIESIGEGWTEHTKTNHNIEKYLKFLVFISQKNIEDCSSLEKHIKICLQKQDFSFIPYQVSMSTQNKDFIDQLN